jgi:hypothetical protein
MHSTDIPKETAREKATRIWRNNEIIRSLNQPTATVQQPAPSKLRNEILSILNSKNTEIIKNYIIMLNIRKRKLLKEKLRRLMEAEQSDER